MSVNLLTQINIDEITLGEPSPIQGGTYFSKIKWGRNHGNKNVFA